GRGVDRGAGAEARAEVGVRLSQRRDGARAADGGRRPWGRRPAEVHRLARSTVAGVRVFGGSQSGTVYALDAKTGCTIWTFQAKGGVRTGIVIGPRAAAPGKFLALFGDVRGNAYGLDAATGEQLWTRQLEDHRFVNITGTPTLYQDRLYVPVASSEEGQGMNASYECCTFRGSLVALVAATRAVVWKHYTLSGHAKPLCT